ncbi:M1 family metallopeptidase, partial [Planctomycetota bacterium]
MDRAILPCVLLLAALPAQAIDVRHDLDASVVPENHEICIQDNVTLILRKPHSELLSAYVHAGLKLVDLSSPGVVHEVVPRIGREHEHFSKEVPLQEIRFRPDGASGWPRQVELSFRLRGKIMHPLTSQQENYARSFQETPGIISTDGVYLSSGSFFYPRFFLNPASFSLTVSLPAGWDAVSQGSRTGHVRSEEATTVTWSSPQPMDDIYLIAAPFTEYYQESGAADLYAFLRTPDAALARKYMDATEVYLDMYSRLLGPYAYKKFALVENFWETGYGMPSFTLLGPRIIRLPFILHTSYPHEILHNWWGNGVFVDYDRGNWCEGLTAYLADHLLKEGAGKGAAYRRSALERYRNFVRREEDFALEAFTQRRSSASEAVGYGKSLMVFHMLRRLLGDETFVSGLRLLYRDRLHREAGFDDLQKAFESAAERSLEPFFDQWVRRPGAPDLELEEVTVHPRMHGGKTLRLTISQVQRGAPFRLQLPVAVRAPQQPHGVVLS